MTAAHNAAAELVRRGTIRPTEAATHPFRNQLIRSLGGQNALPEVVYRGVRGGDRFLLATDGVHGSLDVSRLGELARMANVADAAQAMVAEALAQGAKDNVTAVVVEIADFGPPASDGGDA